MTDSPCVAVIGASGFVGSAVTEALQRRGADVVRLRAPRLLGMTAHQAVPFIESQPRELLELAEQLQGADAVVNAAGNPDASSRDVPALTSANGVLPGVIAAACARASVGRLVHVSSAVVQGRLPVLDESDNADAFSDYSKSKLLGERLTRQFADGEAVIYRPPSVHGADRRVTRLTARIASSPLASVARPGTSPSPQALIDNVADAIAFLATTPLTPPGIVIHPWEGLSTADVMEVLGGRPPRQLPRTLARAVAASLSLTARIVPPLAANARRLEMLWFGQEQAPSWLSSAGWVPPAGGESWTRLGTAARSPETEARIQKRTHA